MGGTVLLSNVGIPETTGRYFGSFGSRNFNGCDFEKDLKQKKMKRLFFKPLRIIQLSLVYNRLHFKPSFFSQRAFSQTREKKSNPKIICSGCGAGLQTRDIAAAGYIPTHKKLLELQKRSEDAIKEASSYDSSSSS